MSVNGPEEKVVRRIVRVQVDSVLGGRVCAMLRGTTLRDFLTGVKHPRRVLLEWRCTRPPILRVARRDKALRCEARHPALHLRGDAATATGRGLRGNDGK